MPTQRHTCSCCGHRTLDDGPGAYDLCPVCFWEDDGDQDKDWLSASGPNQMTLAEGQRRCRRYGTSTLHAMDAVRPPNDDEPLDAEWTPLPEPTWAEEAPRMLPDFGTLLVSAAERAMERARAEGIERAAGHLDGLREAVGMLIEHAHRYGLDQGALGVEPSLDPDRDLRVERPTGYYAG